MLVFEHDDAVSLRRQTRLRHGALRHQETAVGSAVSWRPSHKKRPAGTKRPAGPGGVELFLQKSGSRIAGIRDHIERLACQWARIGEDLGVRSGCERGHVKERGISSREARIATQVVGSAGLESGHSGREVSSGE